MAEILSTGSSWKFPVTPDKACTIVSARAGVCHRQIWNNPLPPGIVNGNDATNNLDVTFAFRDNFGIPTIATAALPNTDDYPAGAQTGNTGGAAAYQTDVWVVVPVGVNTIRLGSRTFGNCAIGMYAGKAFRYAQQIAWNSGGFQSGNIDLTKFNMLCGQRYLAIRLYVANGYFNGGYYAQWNVGAGFVDIPVAACHAVQPSASSWPN